MDGGGVGAGAAHREGEWLRAYGRVEEMLPLVEALAAGRARPETVNGLQHEFWEARDVLLQCRLLQADQSRRRWEAAYMELQHSSDDRRFADTLSAPSNAELQISDLEDLQTFVDLLYAENTEFKVQVKEVDSGAECCQNAADHEHIAGDLKAAPRQLKQTYEALCSEKDKKVSALIADKNKEISALIAEKDLVREQVRTLEQDYAELRSYSSKQAAQVTEAKQELEQLQVASQKKDNEIHKLRARVKSVEAKRNSVPEDNLQEVYCMPMEPGGKIEKCKDRQPETSQMSEKVMSETHNKNCSEGPALMGEQTKNYSSKQKMGNLRLARSASAPLSYQIIMSRMQMTRKRVIKF